MNPFTVMPRERKRIIIVGAVLLVLAAAYRFWPDLAALGDFSAAIDLKKRQIVKYQALAGRKPLLEKHMLTLTRNLERAESRLFDRSTPALAAVDIQSLINEILGRVGLQSDRTRVLKPIEISETPYLRIGVEVSFTADVSRIKQVLYRIESSEKILAIRSLSMNVRTSQKEQVTPVMLQMVVEGIMPDNRILSGGD